MSGQAIVSKSSVMLVQQLRDDVWARFIGGSSFRSGIAFTGNGWGRFMACCCQMEKYVPGSHSSNLKTLLSRW